MRDVLLIESPAPPGPLQRALTEAGFRVQIANSGHLATTAAKKASPDIVLIRSDVGPPGASEIARRIKCEPATRDVPVVLLDAEAHPPPFAYPTEARLAYDVADEEVIRTLRMLTKHPRKVRYSARRETASLEGRFESDDFPEVLQFLFACRKTGRIVVDDGAGRRGFIGVSEGDVVEATLGARFGVSAFSEICFLTAGSFRFEPGRLTTKGSMKESGLELLLESARRKDMDDKEHAEAAPDVTVRARVSSPVVRGRASHDRVAGTRGRRRPSLGAVALVLVGLGAGSLFARATFERSPETATLEIVSEPSGARVFVDEREVGTTPVQGVEVEPGKRLIRVEREGSKTTVELVEIAAGEVGRSVRVSLPEAPPAPAVLKLRRVPSRAKVYVDGILQRSSTRAELAPGSYRVEVEAAGYHRWTELIELEAATQKVLEVELRRSE